MKSSSDLAKEILESNEKTKDFAKKINQTIETAIQILNKIIENPQYSENLTNFMNSDVRSADFKAFMAGEEKGRKEGESAGFAKGAGAAVVLLGMAIIGFLAINKE